MRNNSRTGNVAGNFMRPRTPPQVGSKLSWYSSTCPSSCAAFGARLLLTGTPPSACATFAVSAAAVCSTFAGCSDQT